ncbi:hypothetical protein MHYP_G00119060 [Metynnis hypsauchen]
MERQGKRSLLFAFLSLWLGLVAEADPLGLGVSVARGQISLNDMLKEVEQLMEDTQHKLEEAVHQVGRGAPAQQLTGPCWKKP